MPESAASGLEVGAIVIGLLGGLALFLYGMEQMTDALKRVAGEGLRKVLQNLTKNRFAAAGTGAFVTAIIQSSSVTTVLVVGFISAGLMSLQQSVGVIMGANVGTTVTAQIVAFKVTKYALILIAIGFAMLFLSKRPKVREYGAMTMGLGLVFFGMDLMSQATNPLRTYQPFIDLMGEMENPLFGIAVAAGFTALVQSSSATTGIVIVLASQGFITLEAGIALAFGANIGTCVTAQLAALGKPRTAVQAAAVHVVFNVGGVLLWVFFIDYLAEFVREVSPADADLEGSARLAAETPRQIANAHTMFNIANTFFFIWFTGPMARFVERLLPEEKKEEPEASRPQFLDPIFLETPVLAMDRLRLELVRMGRLVDGALGGFLPAVAKRDEQELDAVVARVQEIQVLYEAILDYTRRLEIEGVSERRTRRLATLTAVGADLQHVAETLALSLVGVAREGLARGLSMSPATRAMFEELLATVRTGFEASLDALDEGKAVPAIRCIAMKPEVKNLAGKITDRLAERLAADAPDRIALFRLESQTVELLHRIYYFAKKIAKAVVAELEASGAEEDPEITVA